MKKALLLLAISVLSCTQIMAGTTPTAKVEKSLYFFSFGEDNVSKSQNLLISAKNMDSAVKHLIKLYPEARFEGVKEIAKYYYLCGIQDFEKRNGNGLFKVTGTTQKYTFEETSSKNVIVEYVLDSNSSNALQCFIDRNPHVSKVIEIENIFTWRSEAE